MRLHMIGGGVPLALCLMLVCRGDAFAAAPTDDSDTVRAAIAAARSTMTERGTTGTISDTQDCYRDAAGQTAPARVKFCLAFDLTAYRLDKTIAEANGWPRQDFYQPNVFGERAQAALRQSSIPVDDRLPTVVAIRGIVDEAFGGPVKLASEPASQPAVNKGPDRPKIEALVFDRAALTLSDPWAIPFWDHANQLIKQFNDGDQLDLVLVDELKYQPIHGRDSQSPAAAHLGALAASAANTMTNIIRRENLWKRTGGAEAAFKQNAAQALVREQARIGQLGLPKSIIDGTLYFRFSPPFGWLTVGEWLAMVLENPEVKTVTSDELQSDHSPVVSIKRPGQETFSFAFSDDGGDIFIRAFGPGEKLKFTRNASDDFGALSWMQTFAKDAVSTSELVPPG
jgi:hypothetical protein